MDVATFSYDARRRWSVPEFPALDSPRTLVLAFGASSFLDDPHALRELRAAYPRAAMVGCSTAGEILGTRVSDDSLALAVARFDETAVEVAHATVDAASGSYAAGVSLARALTGPGLRAIVVLSDGVSVNGSELVRGINAERAPGVVVTGGLAGDGDRFGRTWVLQDAVPRQGVVSAVGLYGARVRVGHGSRGGWDIFGPERVITRSTRNVLYELDDSPALELYKRYLGERAAGLPATALLFPLAVRDGPRATRSLVRTVLAVDEAAQSLTFAGDMPQGSLAQLMRANFDRLIGGASDAGHDAARGADAPGATLALAISCVGRRLVLGERTEEELEAVEEALPPRSALVGFYSYGEISPYVTGSCDLHNQTMTLTTLGEG